MITAVELFDRAPIDNLISILTVVPDKIIYIGDITVMEKYKKPYEAFVKGRDLDTELEFWNIDKNDIFDIVNTLSEIVETEDNCVFDLTGGEDLALVAMGIVYNKYPEKNIQLQRFNVVNGMVSDCDQDGVILYNNYPQLSVTESILIHGGAVRFEGDDSQKTYEWDLTDEFKEAVSKMWNICREDPGLWNARLKVMSCIEKYFTSDLGVFFDTETLKERLEEENIKYVEIESFLKQIYHSDWIDYLIINGDEYSYFYKNEQLKKCLTKAGTILELKVYITALNVKDKDGYSYFNDALCGVHIDWDGVFHNREDIEKDTANEIDVVLTKGIVPIFISCKNGEIKEDELYKLETVADRYGGKHVKKVLISTYFGNKGYESTEYLRQRAKDMKISFIEGVHNIDSDIQFEKMLKKLKNYCEMSFE